MSPASTSGFSERSQCEQRALEHAVEGQRLARLVGLVAGHALEIVAEVALERGLQLAQIGARVVQDLGAARVVEQREEQVLDRHVGVPARDRLAHRRLEHDVKLAADLAHSCSTPDAQRIAARLGGLVHRRHLRLGDVEHVDPRDARRRRGAPPA